jgi:hypothetical protein
MPLALLALSLGCRGEPGTGPGRVEVEWTGADTGRLRVPATARWCGNDSVVEITGAAGDSGVALALLVRDTSVGPGVFDVAMPLAVLTRPAARVAVRWPGETMTEGYYGVAGTVTVDSGGGMSGSVQAMLRSVVSGREITMTGRFRELEVRSGSPGSCGIPAAPARESTP